MVSQQGRRERASSNGVAGMIPTAAIERAHSYRARSGSTGIVQAAPFSFFSILRMCFAPIAANAQIHLQRHRQPELLTCRFHL